MGLPPKAAPLPDPTPRATPEGAWLGHCLHPTTRAAKARVGTSHDRPSNRTAQQRFDISTYLDWTTSDLDVAPRLHARAARSVRPSFIDVKRTEDDRGAQALCRPRVNQTPYFPTAALSAN